MYSKPIQQVTLCQVSNMTELENKTIFHVVSLPRSHSIPRKNKNIWLLDAAEGKYRFVIVSLKFL